MSEQNDKSLPSFVIHKSKRAAIIRYKHGTTEHSIIVPFSVKNQVKMRGKKVYLVNGDDREEITQQYGCSYMLSAKELGYDHYLIEGEDGTVEKRDTI